MKVCAICNITSDVVAIHVHHVVGRSSPQRDEPQNLIELCYIHHDMWHTNRPEWLEDKVYRYMKSKYGSLFPIWRDGHPIQPKWYQGAERRANELHKNSND